MRGIPASTADHDVAEATKQIIISRRAINSTLLAATALFQAVPAVGQEEESSSFNQLIYPPFGALDAPQKFGYEAPTRAQKEKVDRILQDTPKGPSPLAIARSFSERYGKSDPQAISQWPAPAAWNPLVVEFFRATSLKVNNDMVAWCAAFANWCIERNGRTGTRSAASQSFVDPKNARYFKKTQNPDIGDLVVWTCYEATSGKNLGLGHVAFVTGKPDGDSIPTISGNMNDDNHSSIIVEKPIPVKDRKVYRTINGSKVLTVMKLNAYLKMA
ncbi:MAG: CHAP domain-containing protein [Acetobacteraceae bacterium]